MFAAECEVVDVDGAFTISPTAMFDCPTIGSLGEYSADQMPAPDA